VLSSPFRSCCLSSFRFGWFPIRTSRFRLLSFLFVSFRPSLLRSRSRFTGARLSLSLRRLPWLPLSFVRFRFRLLTTQPLFLPFRFPCLASTAGSSGSARSTFVSLAYPVRSAWFPMRSFRFFLLSFPFVSFRPSLLRSHGCFTGACLSVPLRHSPLLPLSFVRFRFRLRLLGFLSLPFPSSQTPLNSRFCPVPVYPLPSPPVSMRAVPLRYSAFPAIPFPGLSVSPHRGYLSSRPSFPFPLALAFHPRAVPLAFALGSGFGQGDTP